MYPNALYAVIVSSITNGGTTNAMTTMQLLKFDLNTHTLTKVSDYTAGQNGNGQMYNTSTTPSWNGFYSDSAGHMYGSEGISGQIWNFTLTAPYTANLVSYGPASTLADGARCLLAAPV